MFNKLFTRNDKEIRTFAEDPVYRNNRYKDFLHERKFIAFIMYVLFCLIIFSISSDSDVSSSFILFISALAFSYEDRSNKIKLIELIDFYETKNNEVEKQSNYTFQWTVKKLALFATASPPSGATEFNVRQNGR